LSSPPSIVIYFAHPAMEQSVINQALRGAVMDLPNVDFRDLLELYPDFYIDVAAEQCFLRKADLVVFQHPIYWYAAPAIFKHFVDTVLTRGFAYGPGGTALQGKDFLLVTSTGADVAGYERGGLHEHPFAEFLLPVQQTARFCGMNFLPPIVVHGGHGLPRAVIAAQGVRYRQFLKTYQPGAPWNS